MTELSFTEKEGYWESETYVMEGSSFGLMVKIDETLKARSSSIGILRSADGENFTQKVNATFLGDVFDATIGDGVEGLSIVVRVNNKPEKIVVL